jgi:hypothetical protein
MDTDPEMAAAASDLKSIWSHAMDRTNDRVREMKLDLCSKFEQERTELNAIVRRKRIAQYPPSFPPSQLTFPLTANPPSGFPQIEQISAERDDALGKLKKMEIEAGGNKETMDRVRDQL